jgi:hypothetical protein
VRERRHRISNFQTVFGDIGGAHSRFTPDHSIDR